MKTTKTGPGGVILDIDTSDYATPALVWESRKRRFSATFDCAIHEGELDCGAGPSLTQEQIDWLDQFHDLVTDAYSEARKGMKEYE